MDVSRRELVTAVGGIGLAAATPETAAAWQSHAPPDPYGCLVDLRAFTVVNRHCSSLFDEHARPVPTYVKVQCMHCQVPACVSACGTGAVRWGTSSRG